MTRSRPPQQVSRAGPRSAELSAPWKTRTIRWTTRQCCRPTRWRRRRRRRRRAWPQGAASPSKSRRPRRHQRLRLAVPVRCCWRAPGYCCARAGVAAYPGAGGGIGLAVQDVPRRVPARLPRRDPRRWDGAGQDRPVDRVDPHAPLTTLQASCSPAAPLQLAFIPPHAAPCLAVETFRFPLRQHDRSPVPHLSRCLPALH